MDKKEKDILKLSKLLEHWAEHNNSHKESFTKWRDIAKNHKLDSIADNITRAIEMLDKSTEFLLKAQKEVSEICD